MPAYRRDALVVASFVFLAGFAAPLRAEPLSPEDVAGVIEPFLEKKPHLGLVVGVVDADGTRLQYFGAVERDGEKSPPKDDALFEIGSITKTFTATLLQSLADDGIVKLDDPANKYLPAEWQVPKEEGREITLTELSAHCSGLPVQPPLIGFIALSKQSASNPYSVFDGPALAETMKTLKLQNPIGEKYVYSNLAVGLLGHALASAAKAESYEQLLRDRVLTPLEMTDTALKLSDEQLARLAQPHTEQGAATPAWDFATLEACGGIRSTPRDMLRWLEAHLGRIETPIKATLLATHEKRFPVGREAAAREPEIGLGWHLIPIPDQKERAVFHNGGTYGSRSFLAFLPSAGRGVLILSNSGASVDGLGITLMKRLMDESPK